LIAGPALDLSVLAERNRASVGAGLEAALISFAGAAMIDAATAHRGTVGRTRVGPQGQGSGEKLDFSDAALICLSSIDMKIPAHIHYAARRLKSRAPHAKLLLGVWAAKDGKALTDLKDAVNADDVVSSFQQAAAIILQEAIAEQRGRTASGRHH
jgi:hypothetical protein